MYNSNVFFHKGDVVKLKQPIANLPEMIVSSIPKSRPSEKKTAPILHGIVCFWFATDFKYQEHIFNSKDLVKVKPAK